MVSVDRSDWSGAVDGGFPIPGGWMAPAV